MIYYFQVQERVPFITNVGPVALIFRINNEQTGDTSAGVMIIHAKTITKFKCDYCMRNFLFFFFVMLIKLFA